VKDRHLTPEARLERAKRTIAEGISEMIEATIARGVAANEWVDQNHSPLGKRKHLELARAGKLPSKKVGRDVLVKRDDLNAYIQREGISRGRSVDDEDVLEIVERIAAGGRRR
jgi:excisionase family DNA binding protein